MTTPNDATVERPIEHPCDYCGREIDGSWFAPCPSGDCPSHDELATLRAQNAKLVGALRGYVHMIEGAHPTDMRADAVHQNGSALLQSIEKGSAK